LEKPLRRIAQFLKSLFGSLKNHNPDLGGERTLRKRCHFEGFLKLRLKKRIFPL